ncbi:MAG: tetratricopeptide repeat protein [Candidatus Competibacteraceae bacterium]|nr:tetratricopeptide repeat protein [Candidatus Competibacteraceae bacterium]
MKAIILTGLLGTVLAVQSQTIEQSSQGLCSPNIAEVNGNVTLTINCLGLTPQAQARLNELLDFSALVQTLQQTQQLNNKTLKRLHDLLDRNEQALSATETQLAKKFREAEEWASKYRELEARLVEQGSTDKTAEQAEEALKNGDLDRAGELIDQLIAQQEQQLDQLATNHFNRARVFELQFRPLKVLPHLEKAHRYRPDNTGYGFVYARLLQQQNRFNQAIAVYKSTLDQLNALTAQNREAYLPYVATTLNNLAILYLISERAEKAELLLQEALVIGRDFVKIHFAVHRVRLVTTLKILTYLYESAGRTKEAEQARNEMDNL